MNKTKILPISHEQLKLAVVGLGYVGLPLAFEFSKYREVIGYDIDKNRVKDLKEGKDKTASFSSNEMLTANNLKITNSISDLSKANCYIVTVPTPIRENKEPDLSFLKEATKLISSFLKKGDIVIYESTVYPGCTEEDCVPILENSGLKYNKDFFCGYSPERINPGDKLRKLPDIIKVTSGSTEEVSDLIDSLYSSIIRAGTYKAESIKVAEAAKVIENTQRDTNIALINELAIIFSKLDLDTSSVLEAAETKWNFIPFKPGIVGGHCISVDPYYLSYKSKLEGYNPEVILSGRRVNSNMVNHIINEIEILLKKKKVKINSTKGLVMGITFKENCPDTRDSRVIELVHGLKQKNVEVDVYDPWINQESKNKDKDLDIKLLNHEPLKNKYDFIVIAVAHDIFLDLGFDAIRSYGKKISVIYDIKSMFPKGKTDGRL